jgi:glycosyltransferase involved in cell wall biosynthesis
MSIPAASIVIPTFNKARYLELTLASLTKQTETTFEVVVVNDGSTDDTEAVIARFRKARVVSDLKISHAGRAIARNAGIKKSRGRIVIFTDDDRVVAKDFVAAHLQLHASTRQDVLAVGRKEEILTRITRGAIGGRSIPRFLAASAKRQGKRQGLEGLQLVGAKDIETRLPWVLANYSLGPAGDNYDRSIFADGGAGFAWAMATTGNMSLSRGCLAKIGFFDEQFQGWGLEDTDLAYRAYLTGVQIVTLQAAVNYHQHHTVYDSLSAGNIWDRQKDGLQNLRRFCLKHSSLETAMLWAFKIGRLTMSQARMLLKHYRALPADVQAHVIGLYEAGLRQ